MALEDEFMLEISDQESEKIQTAADAIDYISSHPFAKWYLSDEWESVWEWRVMSESERVWMYNEVITAMAAHTSQKLLCICYLYYLFNIINE